MATEKQIQANRNNAQKSTGPRTDQGKSRASQNALRHGLLARDAVLRGEDPAEFEAQLAALETDIQPVGALEQELVRQMADAQWRMRRLARLESGYLSACLVKSNHHTMYFQPYFLQPGYEGETLLLGHAMLSGTKELTHLARYDAHLGRRFERALQQITKLRESREKRAQASPKSDRHTIAISTDSTSPAPPDAAKTPPSKFCGTNPISTNSNEINGIAPINPANPHPARPETRRNAPQPTGRWPAENQIAPSNGAASRPDPLSR